MTHSYLKNDSSEGITRGIRCKEFHPFMCRRLIWQIFSIKAAKGRILMNVETVDRWKCDNANKAFNIPTRSTNIHTLLPKVCILILKAPLLDILLNVLYFRQLFCVLHPHNIWHFRGDMMREYWMCVESEENFFWSRIYLWLQKVKLTVESNWKSSEESQVDSAIFIKLYQALIINFFKFCKFNLIKILHF